MAWIIAAMEASHLLSLALCKTWIRIMYGWKFNNSGPPAVPCDLTIGQHLY